MTTYDAVVVGARCAGSVVSGLLARAGWKVLVVDKARFPSDTISTHAIFPNTLARFESLGILERLHGRHEIPYFFLRWRIIGYELGGPYTPVGGHELGSSIRRVALDSVLVDWAKDSGAEVRQGAAVRALIGTGADNDPVKGVVLETGEEIATPLVIGADGRASKVARLLELEDKKPMAGDMSYLFAYWRGLPRAEFGTLEVNDRQEALMRNPCEDGIDILSVAGPADMTRGSHSDREARYRKGLQTFPESVALGLLDRAERVSDLVVVPERMMRGYFRKSNGPGWVLIGDAGHFKHPGTAQGISDAVEQAVFVADSVTGSDPKLSGFHDWRKDRSEGHYEWSFTYGSWPIPAVAGPYLSGLSSDADAKQDWVDTFTRTKSPSDVNTPERLERWFSSPAGS
ncbi:MAG TPA: NAD(P)/FAD-dependent oxidoreductase [Actinomycetota bacterium]|nr:NAD(P)/FAD-dependent oxidoreductase [Actinomycetota bacterium]